MEPGLPEARTTGSTMHHSSTAAATFTGHSSIRGRSETLRMILLTLNTIGISFTWGVEMTYCTPYLLNLGLTKSSTSAVWIAGPLSGLIVQPIVGVIADESTSRWGRRRPFIVVGTLATAMGMLVLGFTREIVGLLLGQGSDADERARVPTIVLAVLAIYVTDFAINAVMSCSMSLVVDTLSAEKQQTGTSWCTRMGSVGQVLGYAAGASDLVAMFGTSLGSTQFKQLTLIAAMVMIVTNSITCWAVTERVLLAPPAPAPSSHSDGSGGRFKVIRRIWSTVLSLPPRINAVCWAQFWSWIGWFPFLFYNTTWIGETYFRYDASPEDRASPDVLGKMGRIGSTSLVIYSSITFSSAFLLPLLVRSPEDGRKSAGAAASPIASILPAGVVRTLARFKKYRPDLLTTWMAGQLGFSAAMFLAPWARSYRFATVLICICGIPWTIASWAPMTFLGIEVNRMSGKVINDTDYQRLADAQEFELDSRNSDEDAPLRHLPDGADEDPENAAAAATATATVAATAAGAPSSSTGELSGIYFGILNIFTTLPQFVGTFISSIVFSILDPGRSPELAGDGGGEGAKEPPNADGPNAVAVCLFIGAFSSLVAMYVTRRLRHL